MASPLTGIDITQVGQGYDVAIGFDTGSTIQMVGYVLKSGPGGNDWNESTDIQDEEHLVQVSTNQTDRFTRYPKITQGDFTGGERQVFFVDPTKYFSSDGNINTAVPGNLTLFQFQQTQQVTGLTGTLGPVAQDNVGNVYVAALTATKNLFVLSSITLAPTGLSAGDGNQINDLLVTPFWNQSGVICGFLNGGAANNGILRVSAAGATIQQLTNDAVASNPQSMAYFNGDLFYILLGGTTVRHFTGGLASPPGNAAGANVFSLPTGESFLSFITSTATSLYWGTNGIFETTIWQSDGANNSRIGSVPGTVKGVGEANGIVYLNVLTIPSVGQGASTGFVIYQIDGSSISVFDDIRNQPSQFLAQSAFGNLGFGNLFTDGRYLYVAASGYPLRAYDLTIPGNPVYQLQPFFSTGASAATINSTKATPVLSSGSGAQSPFVVSLDTSNNTATYATQQNTVSSVTTGSVTLSYMDFGAPSVVKTFRSVELDMVTSVVVDPPGGVAIGVHATQVTIAFRLDNQTVFTNLATPTVTNSGNLVVVFPIDTRGFRCQLRVSLSTNPAGGGGQNPVVRSVSLLANLGRVWTFTVDCNRNARLRNQGTAAGEDTQGLNAQAKLKNILNAYRIAAGNITMFVPSPTKASGVEQVNAVLQDYKYGTLTQVGPYSSEYGNFDMEGQVQVVATETL